jgi:Domain of unknown function (DUF4160)
MVTVHREAGLRIMIFSQDHSPPHVHVFGDGHARIDLIGPEGQASLALNKGFTRGQVSTALRIVNEQRFK